ncbi:MAG: ABC transporter ATP-binding protein [Candidatus Dormibacteria bacterium]
MSVAIAARGLGKRYVKLEEAPVLGGWLLGMGRDRESDFWALRDVDLEVMRGETIGLIGRNGSGKTTLLRMMAGISQPTEGTLRVVGRIAPLISVGVGFRPEMTGRENVILNGMLLGQPREEMERRLAEIVEFAELEDFIDVPVKFYSSGMFLRLGYSVAVHVDPDILLVDEVLAVGDIGFQRKCVERMAELQAAGTTVVLVSHAMGVVRSVCSRVVVMAGGKVDFVGDPSAAIARYFDSFTVPGAVAPGALERQQAISGDGHVVAGGVTVLDQSLDAGLQSGREVTPGEAIVARIRVRFDVATESPVIGIQVLNESGEKVYAQYTEPGRKYSRFAAGEEVEVMVRLRCHLVGGWYRLVFSVTTTDARQVLAADLAGMTFGVAHTPFSTGVADLEGSIEVASEVISGSTRSFERA